MRRCPCIAQNTKIGGGRRQQLPSCQIFSWPSRCGGEDIRLIVRDKELFVNREQVRASFCKNGEAWFVCVRSRSDGYWWKMGGTTSSPTQDLFDSQDFENAGIGHGNITSFKLILQMLGVMLHLRRGNYYEVYVRTFLTLGGCNIIVQTKIHRPDKSLMGK